MVYVKQVYLNVSMALGFDGLSEIVSRHQKKIPRVSRVNVRELPDTELLVFVNKAKNSIKVLASGNTLAYVRLPKHRVIDLRTIQNIPKVFSGGGSINYDGALEQFLTQALAVRKTKPTVQLGYGQNAYRLNSMEAINNRSDKLWQSK